MTLTRFDLTIKRGSLSGEDIAKVLREVAGQIEHITARGMPGRTDVTVVRAQDNGVIRAVWHADEEVR